VGERASKKALLPAQRSRPSPPQAGEEPRQSNQAAASGPHRPVPDLQVIASFQGLDRCPNVGPTWQLCGSGRAGQAGSTRPAHKATHTSQCGDERGEGKPWCAAERVLWRGRCGGGVGPPRLARASRAQSGTGSQPQGGGMASRKQGGTQGKKPAATAREPMDSIEIAFPRSHRALAAGMKAAAEGPARVRSAAVGRQTGTQQRATPEGLAEAKRQPVS